MSFWDAIVRLPWLVYGDDGCVVPRVVTIREGGVEEERDDIGSGFVGPFQDLVADAA